MLPALKYIAMSSSNTKVGEYPELLQFVNWIKGNKCNPANKNTEFCIFHANRLICLFSYCFPCFQKCLLIKWGQNVWLGGYSGLEKTCKRLCVYLSIFICDNNSKSLADDSLANWANLLIFSKYLSTYLRTGDCSAMSIELGGLCVGFFGNIE